MRLSDGFGKQSGAELRDSVHVLLADPKPQAHFSAQSAEETDGFHLFSLALPLRIGACAMATEGPWRGTSMRNRVC